jgi:hypothetical protein
MSIAFLRHFLMRNIAFLLSTLLLGHALHSSGFALPLRAHAFAGERQQTCDGCADTAQEKSALCGFKYMVFFFWYAGMAIACAVAIIMDIATGFTQQFTKSFVLWFLDKNAELSKFFTQRGC